MIGDIYVPSDKGCKVEPSCLNCRLPVCIYDLPEDARQSAAQRWRTTGAHAEIWAMHSQGATTQAIATAVGLTARTVRRVIVWREANDLL